jgi:hypothetical protein
MRLGVRRWAKKGYRVHTQSGDFVSGRGAFGSRTKYDLYGGVVVTYVKDTAEERLPQQPGARPAHERGDGHGLFATVFRAAAAVLKWWWRLPPKIRYSILGVLVLWILIRSLF